MELTIIIIGIIIAILLAVLLILILKKNQNGENQELLDAISRETARQQSELRQELSAQTQTSVSAMGVMLERRLQSSAEQTERQLEVMRSTMEKRLDYIQEGNSRQLDVMRRTVDEKLGKTREEKMNRSFSLVSTQLEQVYKGLGEMQTLAVGVGDLKKVLSNVKTRGILGEIQLGSILEEILAPELYETEVATVPNSREHVEYAVKLPGAADGTSIYLPIDSKFPGDTYAALQEAYESGDKERVDAAKKTLVAVIKKCAGDIRSKYVSPPHTTNFGIMFLPFEGLYSEVVNRGMVEELQRRYKVTLAGPSTVTALLNALQMGFRTLAVQKRSAEVWDVLRGVKREFDSFADTLEKTQTRLEQANRELDNLVGVRTRQMQKQLAKVQTEDTE